MEFRKHIARIIAFVMLVVSLVSVMTPVQAVTASEETVSSILMGDADKSGSVTTTDVRRILQFIVGNIDFDEEQRAAADVNQDGTISSADARELLKVILGESTITTTTATTTTTTTTTTITTTTTTFIDEEIAVTLTAVDPADYYGRQVLARSDNPELLAAYDYLNEQVQLYQNVVRFADGGINITTDEAGMLMYYFIDDHPEVFWIKHEWEYYSFGYNEYGDRNTIIVLTYLHEVDEIEDIKQQLEVRTAELLEGITKDTPIDDIRYTVLERLCLEAEYDYTYNADHNHDLVGVLLNGTGVCESYSRAYQYLMYRCGIQCIQVHSNSHIWNILDVDGGWVMTDATWADNGNYVDPFYYEFGYEDCTDSSHTIEIRSYPLPGYVSTAA